MFLVIVAMYDTKLTACGKLEIETFLQNHCHFTVMNNDNKLAHHLNRKLHSHLERSNTPRGVLLDKPYS